MRICIVILFLSSISTTLFSQGDGHKFDELVSLTFRRYVEQKDYDQGKAGANFIKVTKKDSSIKLESIFKTSKKFCINNLENIAKKLNEQICSLVDNQFDIIVPVYLYFGENPIPLSKRDNMRIDNELSTLKRRHTIINNPVIITGYEPMN